MLFLCLEFMELISLLSSVMSFGRLHLEVIPLPQQLPMALCCASHYSVQATSAYSHDVVISA